MRIADQHAGTINLDSRNLCMEISSLLHLACKVISTNNKKLVVILDGFHRVKGYTNRDDFLPPSLPTGLVVVTSSHLSDAWSKYLTKRENNVVIKVPNLDISERKSITRHCLQIKGKKLDEKAFNNELNLIVGKRDAGNAGYLQMLTSEISSFGVFEELKWTLNKAGGTVKELLEQMLDRLEIENGYENVKNILSFLALSKNYGLSELQLQTALAFNNNCDTFVTKSNDISFDQDGTKEVEATEKFGINSLQLSFLINALETFLQTIDKDSLLSGVLLLKEGEDFLHTIKERYFKEKKDEEALQKVLSIALFYLYQKANNQDPLLLSSLPYHLAKANFVKPLQELLCDLYFIQSCAHANLLDQVLSNVCFANLTGTKRIKEFFFEKIRPFHDFVRLHQNTLSQQPCLTFQLALNEPERSPVFKKASESLNNNNLSNNIFPPYVFEWDNKTKEPVLQRKENLSAHVTSNCLETDPTLKREELFAALGMSDGSIVISLALRNDDLFTLFGHSSPVTALTFLKSSGNTILVSGCTQGVLNFWDVNSRIRLSSVHKAHNRQISGLASSCDGMTMVSVGWDGLIKVWSGKTFQEISCIHQLNRPLNAVVYHPEKDFIVTGGWDGVLKVYDLTSLERKAVVRGHRDSIQCIKMSNDAKKIFSCSLDGNLKVFDSQIGEEIASVEIGQTVYSMDLDESSKDEDKVKVYLGLRDGKVQIWSLSNGNKPKRVVQILEQIEKEFAKRNAEKEDNDRQDFFFAEHFKGTTFLAALPAKNLSLKKKIEGDGEKGKNFLMVGYESGYVQQIPNSGDVFKLTDSPVTKIVNFLVKEHVNDDDSKMDWSAECESEFGNMNCFLLDDDDDERRKMLLHVAFTGRGEIYCLHSRPDVEHKEMREEEEIKRRKTSFSVCAQMIGIDQYSIKNASKIGNGGLLVTTREGAFLIYDMTSKGIISGENERIFLSSPSLVHFEKSEFIQNWTDFEVCGDLVVGLEENEMKLNIYKVEENNNSSSGKYSVHKMAQHKLEDFGGEFNKVALVSLSGKNGVILASDQSDKLNIYQLKEEENGLQQIVLKMERSTSRGPINELRSVSFNEKINGDTKVQDFTHFCCFHKAGGVSLWSSKGVELRYVPCHKESSFTIRDRELFVMEGDGSLKTYDLFESNCLRSLNGHQGVVTGLLALPGHDHNQQLGTVCISSSIDKKRIQWVVEEEKSEEEVTSGLSCSRKEEMERNKIGKIVSLASLEISRKKQGAENCENSFSLLALALSENGLLSTFILTNDGTGFFLKNNNNEATNTFLLSKYNRSAQKEKFRFMQVSWLEKNQDAILMTTSTNQGLIYFSVIDFVREKKMFLLQQPPKLFNSNISRAETIISYNCCRIKKQGKSEEKFQLIKRIRVDNNFLEQTMDLDLEKASERQKVVHTECFEDARKMFGHEMTRLFEDDQERMENGILLSDCTFETKILINHAASVVDGLLKVMLNDVSSWLTCVAKNDDKSIWLCDTLGRIFLQQNGGKVVFAKKCHRGAITSIKSIGEKNTSKLLLTTSLDGTLKVWKCSSSSSSRKNNLVVDDEEEKDICQLAEFGGKNVPLTSLAVLNISKTNEKKLMMMKLMVGDSNGETYFLTLREIW